MTDRPCATQRQRWDQQKIGALTGEDVSSARFMRQNDFQFRPEFTLIIVGTPLDRRRP